MGLSLPHMRVLIVSHSSVVDVYQDKLRYIARTPGIELTLLVPDRFSEGGRVIEAFKGHGGYEVITRPQRTLWSNRLNAYTFQGLASVFRKVKPDIVHIEEEPESLVAVQIVRHAVRMKKRPLIIDFTWRNMIVPLESLASFDPRRLLYALTHGMNLPNFDGIIGGSVESEGFMRTCGFEGPVRVIPQYGIDPARYFPRDDVATTRKQFNLGNGSDADPFTIGFVGRVMKMKGLDTLVDAFVMLRDRNAQLVILGGGEYLRETQERVEAAGLTDKVHFISGVPAAEVPPLLSAMDVLCVPSLSTDTWREQFGRVLIEAMACGVPVLGSTSGEIPHVLGDAGLIAEEGNVQEWADALMRLMDDRALRASMRAKGIKRVAEHYTNEHLAKQITDFYAELQSSQSTTSK